MRIKTLHENTFRGSANLTELTLMKTGIKVLPEGLFRDLPLTKLDMNSNSIKDLQAGVFSDLLSLRRLDLGQNNFTELPAGVFRGLSNLTDLSIAVPDKDIFTGDWTSEKGYLEKLNRGVFGGLSKLKHLDLRRNRLKELPAEGFSDLSNLLDLWLPSNSLETLPADAFKGLSSLKILDLRNNRLKEHTAEGVGDLSNLQDLGQITLSEIAGMLPPLKIPYPWIEKDQCAFRPKSDDITWDPVILC